MAILCEFCKTENLTSKCCGSTQAFCNVWCRIRVFVYLVTFGKSSAKQFSVCKSYHTLSSLSSSQMNETYGETLWSIWLVETRLRFMTQTPNLFSRRIHLEKLFIFESSFGKSQRESFNSRHCLWLF